MNLERMVINVFNNLGRPSDISPLTILDDDATMDNSLPGFLQLAEWINLGYEALTKWKTPSGRYLRLEQIVARKITHIEPYSVIEYACTEDSHDFILTDDHYVGFVPPTTVLVSITEGLGAGYSSLAYFSDATNLYLFDSFPANDATSVVLISERGYDFRRAFGVDHPYAFRAIRLLNLPSEVELAAQVENFTGQISTEGIPTEYFKEKTYLYFDKVIDELLIAEFEYDEQILPMTELTDIPSVPTVYHMPIVYWATQQGLYRGGESDEGYKMSRTYDTAMRSIFWENEKNTARTDGGFQA